MEKVTVSCPGTCGELIQGYVNQKFLLVSCSINAYSIATVTKDKLIKEVSGDKSKRAMQLALEYLGISKEKAKELNISIDSTLSLSKGMASSTADMAASIYAAGLYFENHFTTREVAEICTKVEPTDSSFFNSVTLFDSRNAQYIAETNWQPKYYILMLEPNQKLNTEAFHTEITDQLFKEQAKSFSRVHTLYLTAIKERCLDKLGKAATESALLNQAILPKPFFNDIVNISISFRSSFGVNVAHSGTVIGILLRDLSELESIRKKIVESKVITYYQQIKLYESCYEGLQVKEG